MAKSSEAPSSVNTLSGLSDLTLSVRQEGAPEQEVFLQHGLSIGRNPSNTVCIEHPDVERIHAQVMKQPDGSMILECLGEHMSLTLANGNKVQSLPLKPGTTFKLGKATIRCLKRETKATVVLSANPWEVRCPRCHEVIATLPHDSTHCPQCNLEMHYFQSHVGSNDKTNAGPGVEAFEGWLPRAVGPYKIRAFVAQGGMGIVLRGLHTELDLPAAVKLLRMDSEGDPSWEQRFKAEIDTLKSMKHPHVVRLQDHGKDDKLIWLAMDWIDGESLAKWAAKHRSSGGLIPIDQIKDVLSQVVQGLLYLHQKQIVHRDLKPSNILLANDGLVKMVDFGIARNSSGQTAVMTQLTHTGMVAGTESYMSPEQGEGGTITPASDIYSLGVIWYELVTGRRPIGAFMAPDLARPDCPRTWSQTIGACLAGDPRMRPTLDQVSRVLSGMSAAPVGPPPIIPGPPPLQPQGTQYQQPQQQWPQQPQQPQTGVIPQQGYPQQYQQNPQHPQPNTAVADATAAVTAAASATAQAVGKVAGQGLDAAQRFLKENPPDQYLKKMGPVGGWITSHKKETIGIAIAVFVIILLFIVRACNSDDKPVTPAANNNTTNNNNVVPNNNTNTNNNTTPVVPQMTPAEAYDKAEQLLGEADFNDPTDPKFKQAMVLLQQSAQGGDIRGINALANLYLTPGTPMYNYDQGIYWAKQSAKKGDGEAQQYLRQRGIRW